MSEPTSRDWIRIRHRNTNEYIQGVRYFMNFMKRHSPPDFEICCCPCIKCRNSKKLPFEIVEKHLILYGMDPTYNEWFFHGESNDIEVMVNPTHHVVNDDFVSHQFQEENPIEGGLGNLVDDVYGLSHGTQATFGGNHEKKYNEYKRKAREKLYPS